MEGVMRHGAVARSRQKKLMQSQLSTNLASAVAAL
jgi:hypothetical protein